MEKWLARSTDRRFKSRTSHIFSLFFPKWDKKWVLACPNFGECTARVKLELTDFSQTCRAEFVSMLSALNGQTKWKQTQLVGCKLTRIRGRTKWLLRTQYTCAVFRTYFYLRGWRDRNFTSNCTTFQENLFQVSADIQQIIIGNVKCFFEQVPGLFKFFGLKTKKQLQTQKNNKTERVFGVSAM